MRLDKSTLLMKLLPALTGVLACLCLGHWLLAGGQTHGFVPRLPNADRGANAAATPVARLAGTLEHFGGVPATLPGAWPSFRGPHGDNICTDAVPLARSWPESGPPARWTLALGEGYAGAAVFNGRVYVLDYDQPRQQDALRCFSLADGQEIWRHSYRVRIKRNHGMSRTVPAVTAKSVVTMGPLCHVVCVDAGTGVYRWGIDLVRDYGATVPPWYAGQCPVIDNERAILAPAGSSVLLMAVDCATGLVLWKTPNPHAWTMTHSSVLPITFHGRRMYVYCGSGGVVGVAADTGAILWETSDWKVDIANVPTPVVVGEGELLLSGGYNAGSMLLRLREKAGRIVVAHDFRLPAETFGSDQQTPIFYQGSLYAVVADGRLVCLDLQGKPRWNSGTHRFGLGAYLVADGMIYVLNDSGTLTLVAATPTGYQQLAEAKVLAGHDAWGPMALVNGRLLARDLTTMVCLDVARH